MTYKLASINPFLAARFEQLAQLPRQQPDPEQPVYARLPRAPITASPVPHLTSLYHFDSKGEYGDRRYPGNCGGNLIRDQGLRTTVYHFGILRGVGLDRNHFLGYEGSPLYRVRGEEAWPFPLRSLKITPLRFLSFITFAS